MFKQCYIVPVLFLKANKRMLFPVVFRGERQEFKFFDQMMQLFGNKYLTNSDPAAEDAADGAGKKLHCFSTQFSRNSIISKQLCNWYT